MVQMTWLLVGANPAAATIRTSLIRCNLEIQQRAQTCFSLVTLLMLTPLCETAASGHEHSPSHYD